MVKKVVNFRLSSALVDAAKAEAKRENLTFTAFVARVLADYLRQRGASL